MYRLQLLLFETTTERVLVNPTVMVPKLRDFGEMEITPSEPAPMISNSYLN